VEAPAYNYCGRGTERLPDFAPSWGMPPKDFRLPYRIMLLSRGLWSFIAT